MLSPFEYQTRAIDGLREGFRGRKKRGLLAMLMGAGKTLVALNMMRLAQENGKRCLFLCDRRMLADQAVERARNEGLDSGLILASRGHDLRAPCQFASKQTILSWLARGKIELEPFNLVVVDEAHRAVSKAWLDLYSRWPQSYFVGLTATPCLGNGDGMGAYYDFLVQPIMPSALRAAGRTVRVRAFAPYVPDLKGTKTDKEGDYSARDLSRRLTRENLVRDVAGWWGKLGENRPSIYFGCDVAHATAIRDEFIRAGVPAELICDETPDEERGAIRARLESGQTKVVVNCDVLAEGIDWPFVSCIGLVRPTRRLRRYLQNAGRGMRAHPGKVDCILIDHAGCVLYHGMPDVDREWPLEVTDNVDRINQSKKPRQSTTICCANCSHVFSGSRVCPECGHVHAFQKQPQDYAQKNGTLVEVTAGELPTELSATLMQRYWGSCIGMAIKRGFKAGAAAGMFSGKFKIPPWQAGVRPLPADHRDWQRPAAEVFPGFNRSRK